MRPEKIRLLVLCLLAIGPMLLFALITAEMPPVLIMSANPASIPQNYLFGTGLPAYSNISITLLVGTGQIIPQTVSISTTLGTLENTTVVTDDLGHATTRLFAGSIAGLAEITGMYSGIYGNATGRTYVDITPVLERIDVTPQLLQIPVGYRYNFSAICYDIAGRTMPCPALEWTLGNSAAGTLYPDQSRCEFAAARVIGKSSLATYIRATAVGTSKYGQDNFTVVSGPPAVISLNIYVPPAYLYDRITVYTGQTVIIRASAYDQYGNWAQDYSLINFNKSGVGYFVNGIWSASLKDGTASVVVGSSGVGTSTVTAYYLIYLGVPGSPHVDSNPVYVTFINKPAPCPFGYPKCPAPQEVAQMPLTAPRDKTNDATVATVALVVLSIGGLLATYYAAKR